MIQKMKTVSFTYKLTTEKTGYSVLCLDWSSVFTQGDTIKECKRNAAQVTEMLLNDLLKGSIYKHQYPKIKKHYANPLLFQLSFSVKTGKLINPKQLRKVKPVLELTPPLKR
jgi:predicted RNase H-like HicB family nuclease